MKKGSIESFNDGVMKNLNQILIVSIALLGVLAPGWATNSSDGPREPFIDKGACPFEGCTYREWKVKEDTSLYRRIGSKSVIGIAKKGERVIAVTGEVHTIPGRIKILLDHKEDDLELKAGDYLYVLTYHGEGEYEVWYKGKIGAASDLDAPDEAWRVTERKPQSTWWVAIRLKNGKTGWTKETDNFGNQDALGVPDL